MNWKVCTFIRQLISYFFVGGISALVEWTVFFIGNELIYIHYLFSTVLSFVFSTYVNWVLGRKWTFHSVEIKSKLQNGLKVYAVSFIGLLLNLILMKLFVETFAMYPLIGKILSTGIVFIWNFLIRKSWVYKKMED